VPVHTPAKRKKLAKKIKKLKAEGKPQKVAVARAIATVTPSKVRKPKKRKAKK